MNNIKKIMAALENSECDGLLITSESNRRYATGFFSTAGMAVVGEKGAYFFTDSRYTEAAGRIMENAAVKEVSAGNDYYSLINAATEELGIKKLGFEERAVTYSQYEAFSQKLTAELAPGQDILSSLRAVKSREELEVMIRAQRIAEKSLDEIMGIITTDITERELAAELLYRMLKNGADDKSFDIIAISGEKTSMPHGEPGDVKLKKGFLTIDFGAKVEGYCSDMTRTFCIGQPSDEMRRVYDTVLRAQLAGIAAAKGGVPGKDIDGAARQVISDAGYGAEFGHSFGHSLGIDIHETPNAAPNNELPIPAGAVISAEPGIYLPGKFGVRIEDVLYITEDGCENITKTKKELLVL